MLKERYMQPVVLRGNATPIYTFLSFINERQGEGAPLGGRILDCGAGGLVPPLALFCQHGFEGWGIDVSEEQLEGARAFCTRRGVTAELRRGDMRQMPFEDCFFDYVYEHYSMCHLSKGDTAQAIAEMWRVLKPGGLCFLGVISRDTWPMAWFGEEREPGEFWGREGGEEGVLHSVFSDQEADCLVSVWEVLHREKRVTYLVRAADRVTIEDWMALRAEAPEGSSEDTWRDMYGRRATMFCYAHLYYILRKGA
jgi:SAM-dependent methyltransferase